MKMNHTDAFSILGITTDSNVTPETIKDAYRRAAAKYHPDHNPAGLEMMKLVNVAYDTLKDFAGTAEKSDAAYGEAINTALNAIINLGLNIEICGAWVWVGGNTKSHKETLKAAGFFWSPKKSLWYFRSAEHKSYNRKAWSIEQIRATYGSAEIKKEREKERMQLAYA